MAKAQMPLPTGLVWTNFIQSLITKHGQKKYLGENWTTIVYAELATHGGKMVHGSDIDPYLRFRTDAELTAFLLKWG